MQILSLTFDDRDSDWNLAETSFFSDLTLLVGISGVGKTQILRAISTLRKIATGDDDVTPWGISWTLKFQSDDHKTFTWSGRFEEKTEENSEDNMEDELFIRDDSSRKRPRLISESLASSNGEMIRRNEKQIVFNNKPTVKLSPYDSALHLLREEDEVSPVTNSFEKLLSVDQQDEPRHYPLFWNPYSGKRQFASLEELRQADLPTRVKLALVHEIDEQEFNKIAESFMEVFPQVSDVRIRQLKLSIPEHVRQLEIKERGVEDWIPEHKLSSGMKRTLMHFSRISLWPDGMVLIVDEFENSLGVNCIDFLTRNVVDESKRLQFILTSHHPYIINNISTKHWKIVQRTGSKVTVTNASEFGIDSSSHESFIKLINLPQYECGVST